MKSHIKKISVIVALSLVAACPAMEAERPKENTAIQVVGILDDQVLINGKWYKVGDTVAGAKIIAVGSTQVTIERAGDRSTLIAGETTNMKLKNVLVQDAFAAAARTSARKDSENVLVIPTQKINPRDLAAIAEDMSVMCRIFDKKLASSRPNSLRRRIRFFSKDQAAQGIYLEGYGALFTLKVDFPLAPPPPVSRKEQKDDIDHLWEQTRKELRDATTERGPLERARVYLSTLSDLTKVQEYDAEKVDKLEEALVKTLKHAANIRSLKPDQWVAIAVKGPQSVERMRITSARRVADPSGSRDTFEVVTESIQPSPVASAGAHLSNTTVLTIRAKKADIDEFSNGSLNSEQFRGRIRTFIDGTPTVPPQKTRAPEEDKLLIDPMEQPKL